MGAHLTIQPTLIALELNTFQKESKKIIGNINIITNINRIQSCDQFDNVWTLLYWIVLMPAQKCKKCTFLDNLWAITPRRK